MPSQPRSITDLEFEAALASNSRMRSRIDPNSGLAPYTYGALFGVHQTVGLLQSSTAAVSMLRTGWTPLSKEIEQCQCRCLPQKQAF